MKVKCKGYIHVKATNMVSGINKKVVIKHFPNFEQNRLNFGYLAIFTGLGSSGSLGFSGYGKFFSVVSPTITA